MTLSRMCYTDSNYIGQIEMGRRIPSFTKIEEIAAALEITPQELFVYTSEEAAKEKKTKEYIEKMPARIKKEIISCMLTSIKKDIISSFDSEKY